MFAPLTVDENKVLRGHLTSGWYKQSVVYPARSGPYRETAGLLDDLHDAHQAALEGWAPPGAGRLAEPEPGMSFPEDSWVEVRYPLTSEQEHGDREAWPWLPGWVVSECGPNEWEICVQAPELAIPGEEGEANYPVCFRDASELRPQATEPEAGL